MRSQVATLGVLVDDLFELARIDAGALTLELRDAALPPLVESCIRGLEAEAQAKGVRLGATFDREAPEAHCAPEKIERVLLNLLSNALRHTPSDGAIAVRVVPESGGVRVSVEDNGEGLAPESLRRMFDRFWRGDEARSDERRGSRPRDRARDRRGARWSHLGRAEGRGRSPRLVHAARRRRLDLRNRQSAPGESSFHRRPARNRAPRRPDHRCLAVRPAGAADPLRRIGRRRKQAEAVRDHRGPRRQLYRVHPCGRGAPQRARPPPGLPQKPRDRDAARARGHARRSPARPAARTAPLRPDAQAARWRQERLRARRKPRPGVRALRRPRSGRGHGDLGEWAVGLRSIFVTLAYALGAGIPMLAARGRRPASGEGGRSGANPRADDEADCGRRARCDRDRNRPGRRPALHDRAPRIYNGAPEARSSAARSRAEAAPQAQRRRASVSRGDRDRRDGGHAARAGVPGHRRLAEHAERPAADARSSCAARSSSSTSGRTPASTASARSPSEGLGRGLPPGWTRHRRRPHAGVRIRARPLERPRRDARLGIPYPVALDNDYRTWNAYPNQYWPAEYLIDRAGNDPPHAFRRGRIRRDRAGDPQAARRRRCGTRQPRRRHDTDRSRSHPSRTSATRRIARYAGSKLAVGREASYRFPARASAPTSFRSRPLAGRSPAHRRRRGRAATPPLPR